MKPNYLASNCSKYEDFSVEHQEGQLTKVRDTYPFERSC